MGKLENRINRLLNLAGVELRRVRTGPSLRTVLAGFLKSHQVDCVFDVGANTGGYGRFLRDSVGYKGLILSFEPVGEVFRSLQTEAARDPHWIPFQMALGSANQKQAIHVGKVSTFSSFLEPEHQVVEGLGDQNVAIAQEEVAVRRLDSLYGQLKSEHHFSRPFLKADTQGYDKEVFLGAEAVLPEFIGIQSEISFLPIYKQMPGIAEMHPLLARLGFDLITAFPISTDSVGRWVEADCVFTKRP
jgi:FkbM family methyltransferase